MNTMNVKPENMTRVLLVDQDNLFDFGFYKDGMFLFNEHWYTPETFKFWLSIKDLKKTLNYYYNHVL
jgi:hypothetical protein